jgi:hypothetical protein
MQIQSANTPAWLPVAAVFSTLAFVLVAAVIALGVVSLAPAASLAQVAEPDAGVSRRCRECGWIESKDNIASGTDNRAIRLQTYTVRMADGSSRVFTGGPGDHWRVGERLTFIDGDSPSGR